MRKPHKRSILFLTTAMLCIALPSCERISGDIEYIDSDDGSHIGISYGDHSFYSTDAFFTLWTTKDDIELGQYYSFPFSTNIYSHTNDSPFYLWESRAVGDYAFDVYIKEGYNFYDELFYIEGTNIEFVFSEMIIKSESDIEPEDNLSWYSIELSLKDEPRLVIKPLIHHTDNTYYFRKNGQHWFLTDEFVSLLKENNLLPK